MFGVFDSKRVKSSIVSELLDLDVFLSDFIPSLRFADAADLNNQGSASNRPAGIKNTELGVS